MLTEKPLNSISQLPGPKGLPVFGNIFQLDLQKLHSILESWSDSYGKMYKFKIANKTVVAISDSTLIQNILRDRPETYRRLRSIERVARELGIHGVLTAEGEEWPRQRQLTMQAFKPDYLRRFFPEMRKITERLKNRLSSMAESGQAIDVQKDRVRFTVDITTNLAFGYDINLLEEEGDDFQRHLQKLLPVFNRRANAPFSYWHFFKLPSDRAMEKSLAVIKKMIHTFVQQTRQQLEQQPEGARQPANFLEALLLAHDEDGAPLSDLEIQGNIITILLAGEDTTAHTLTWLLYLITEHPEVQLKMQQEADAVLGADTLPKDISTVEQLTYIEAVAHETMRLKSVAPLMFLEPNRDVELAGIAIPKGTFLMLVNRHGALQEENFSNAREFKPERWLESNPITCTHNRNASIPFRCRAEILPGT